jgi:hypothetical protein
VSRSWSFGFAVPKLELGNQKNLSGEDKAVTRD